MVKGAAFVYVDIYIVACAHATLSIHHFEARDNIHSVTVFQKLQYIPSIVTLNIKSAPYRLLSLVVCVCNDE